MTSPLSRAEQAVEAAAGDIASAAASSPSSVGAAIRAFERAVEARYETRLREAANFPHMDDHARRAGHFFADVIADWPTGSRLKFGSTEGLAAPAEACPVHGPTGSPCRCGHTDGADCHPKES